MRKYKEPNAREEFLVEPGAEVFRTTVGGENNAVVLKRASHAEISVVRNDVHYNFSHDYDDATLQAIERMKETARFPSEQPAAESIKRASDPKRQAVAQVLRADSADEARQVLRESGFAAVIERPGYTIHDLNPVGLRSKGKLRIEDLGDTEFAISATNPPILQGRRLQRAVDRLVGLKLFVEYDSSIDGPQTATRLIKETMKRCQFVPSLAVADVAVWIGGTGDMTFAFVVLDARDTSRYRCYACGPRELTAMIMASIVTFAATGRREDKPWWAFWR